MSVSCSAPEAPVDAQLGPEALPAQPFLDLLTGYGSPWACDERRPAAS
jgi:hypothetical protein